MNKAQDSFREADSPGGIMSPCPKCKKQKCMQHAGWTSTRMPCQKVLNKPTIQYTVCTQPHPRSRLD
eukprot:scaffold20437_cov41-Attheya_sp.AAC.1